MSQPLSPASMPAMLLVGGPSGVRAGFLALMLGAHRGGCGRHAPPQNCQERRVLKACNGVGVPTAGFKHSRLLPLCPLSGGPYLGFRVGVSSSGFAR
jgi:hypothetical protein